MTIGDAQSVRPVEAIILAAGKGTRMGSDLAKVLHPVGGRTMVHWVVDACEAVGVRRTVVVAVEASVSAGCSWHVLPRPMHPLYLHWQRTWLVRECAPAVPDRAATRDR